MVWMEKKKKKRRRRCQLAVDTDDLKRGFAATTGLYNIVIPHARTPCARNTKPAGRVRV